MVKFKLSKAKLNKLLKRDIETIVHTIKEKYKPEKIILFGSAARGEFEEGSDIDLFIIKRTRLPLHHRETRIFRLLRHVDRENPIDFIIYTPNEVRRRLKIGDFLIKNIFKEGKVLYEQR